MKFLKKIKDSKLNFILMLLYPIVTFLSSGVVHS